MKVAEILRAVADIIDLAQPESQQEEPVVQVVDVDQQDQEIDQLAKLAGITQASTTPAEEVFPVSASFPAGNDMHYSKNPADIRSDSVSQYPGYGACD